MAVISWPEIEGFHNIRTFLKVDPGEGWRVLELLGGNSKVLYKSKVKLHGTNCAVQCHLDGRVVPQSRTTDLSKSFDQLGFAKFVKDNEKVWRAGGGTLRDNMIIYGEWVGPGIQKSNVAVSDLPKRVFAVFAARPIGEPNPITSAAIALNVNSTEELPFPSANDLITEPLALQAMVEGIPDVYVIPWYEQEIVIDWKNSDEELSIDVARINSWVSAVEDVDPWVSAVFGKQGMGEGLVFYPFSHPGLENFKNLAFKAKGAGHRVVKQTAAAQVNAEVAASVDQFVDMVLTGPRALQGVCAVSIDGTSKFDIKLTGKFVSWIEKDVKKETIDEMLASGLLWEQIQKPLVAKARAWYLTNCGN